MNNVDINKILNVTKNTNNIKPNTAYFCFVGQKFDGHDYVESAFEKGASYVFGTRDINRENYIKVDDVNKAMADIAKEVYDFANNQTKVVGITGTDGKTSTALIMSTILNKVSKATYLGTSGLFINGEERDYNGMTTPFADELYENFKIANDYDSQYFVMEVSSHALEQKRAEGLKYDIAIFTNLTSEHMDFHGSIENYFNAKKKLFNSLNETGSAIINIDTEYGIELANEITTRKVVTIGKNPDADYQISNVKESLSGTTYTLTSNGINYYVNTKLLVEFNVYNLTEALIALVELGYDLETVIKLANDFVIPGRMELIESDKYANVIIDFAHTPDAILKIMQFVDKIKTSQKIYVVMGSAGERDATKRPDMGQNGALGADKVILTEDDPRSELVSNINNDLKKGIDQNKTEVIEIEDRKEAIKEALKIAKEQDIIVLLGKGGQKVMYYDGYTTEYNEQEITKSLMKEGN